MTLVLDAGALIALERNDRAMWIRMKAAVLDGEPPITHAGVFGQIWRGQLRQARLAQALSAIDIRPLDEALARRAGGLLARARMNDVIDAAVIALCRSGDEVVTSDPDDLAALRDASGIEVSIIAC